MRGNLKLPANPSLPDCQSFVGKMVKIKKFHKESVEQNLMFLFEECGELTKSIRKKIKMTVSKKSKISCPEDEASDVFWVLLKICNQLDIDLETAFRHKTAGDLKRVWK
jgi:NTP pyrophosphatase (non-canonical NTP hydrolase)